MRKLRAPKKMADEDSNKQELAAVKESKIDSAKEVVKDNTSEMESLRLKMELLEAENSRLKSGSNSLTKNEEKLLSAIRSEVINQLKDEPIIGRNMLLRIYKINSKYLDDSIKSLESKGIVKRTQVKYSAKIKTNSWKIL
jgi:hypothetical protein